MRTVGILAGALVGAAMVAALAVHAPASGGQDPQATAWREFSGSWSATGQRQTLPAAGARPAATAQLSGAVTITGTEGLSRGFRGEALWFSDGADTNVGHAVWTDEHGDRIFSVLKGEALESRRRVTGTITGGTGRYAGLSGDYAFEWQYVVEAEAGAVQGRTVSLRGRIRAGGSGQ